MSIDEFNTLICVTKCVKCGQDPSNMSLIEIGEDYIITECDNCSTVLKITYSVEEVEE